MNFIDPDPKFATERQTLFENDRLSSYLKKDIQFVPYLVGYTRPGASRGQLEKFYPKYFKDILNLVCNFGFFGKISKFKMNII